MSDNERDELRDEIAGWPISSGYYSTSVGVDEAGEMADALLASPALASRDRRMKAEALEQADREFDLREFDGQWYMTRSKEDVRAALRARAAELREETN